MGCMEHYCSWCDHLDLNNNPKKQNCPKCGKVMYRTCDEVPEKEYFDPDEIDESGEPL